MYLGNGFADIGKLAQPGLRPRLTRRGRLVLEFVVSLIGRSFVTNGIRFLFVDGLFLQRSRSCEDRRLGLPRRRKRPVRMLGSRHDKFLVFFDKLMFHRLSRVSGGFFRLRLAKFTVPLPPSLPPPLGRIRLFLPPIPVYRFPP